MTETEKSVIDEWRMPAAHGSSSLAVCRSPSGAEDFGEQSDGDLVERCRNGDRRAFHGLVLRYRPRVFSMAYRMVGRWEDAEELAQESFLRAFRSIPEFRGECPVSTWIFRICRNLCRNELEWRRRRRPDDGSPEDLPSPEKGALERLVEDERRRLVTWGLSELPPDLREVVVLRHSRQMSYDEIGEILDLPVGTVRSRLHRGRDRLREILRPHWNDSP